VLQYQSLLLHKEIRIQIRRTTRGEEEEEEEEETTTRYRDKLYRSYRVAKKLI